MILMDFCHDAASIDRAAGLLGYLLADTNESLSSLASSLAPPVAEANEAKELRILLVSANPSFTPHQVLSSFTPHQVLCEALCMFVQIIAETLCMLVQIIALNRVISRVGQGIELWCAHKAEV